MAISHCIFLIRALYVNIWYVPPFYKCFCILWFFSIYKIFKSCNCPSLSAIEISLNTEILSFSFRISLDLDSSTSCSLPPFFTLRAARGAPRPPQLVSLAAPLMWPPKPGPLPPSLLIYSHWHFPCLFHVPPPPITKKSISRVCGALCRGAYRASCIINDNSATHVFY